MATLTLEHLTKRYDATAAVADVSLTVAQGELVALLGPSGCGKTTTLRMVAGFVPATEGRILIGGEDVTPLPPHRRDTGMVFQGYALFPHMSVAENVAFGLQMRRVPKAEIGPRVARALELVRLDGLAERKPGQLSGGQQQRVALARALVVEPAVFLLDEPLSNLDAQLRATVRDEIRALQQELGLTTVFVTHDQEEALAIADRLVVMNAGAVEQVGPPEALYDHPRTAFVAGFIGKSNLFAGRVEAPGAFRAETGEAIRFEGGGASTLLAVRPERVALGGEAANRFHGTVEGSSFLGSVIETTVRLEGGGRVVATRPNADGAARARPGERVAVSWPAEASLLLETEAAGSAA
jgi:putative spermidine/putrescine transport system ATP-binding protein